MTARNQQVRFSRLAVAIAAVSFAGTSTPAMAVNFNIGEVEGQFDSTLSVGASWALDDPDPELLGSRAADDGRRNFKQGETFSKVFKGIHDLELKYGDSGIFVRGNYWYDFELKDEGRLFKDIDDSNRKTRAQASGAQLLDAFVYHNWSIGDVPGNARLGKQVVNWGEGIFIPGGINAINPVDVAAFRRPGAEIKEGLIPVNMFYASQSLNDEVSFEGFYQLEWDQTVLDNCGTFFSAADVLADGCDELPSGPALDQDPLAQAAFGPFGIKLGEEGIIVPRAGDRDARDSGQWGLAVRWFAPALETEFGGYVMNYHSRQGYLGYIRSPHVADLGFAPQLCSNLGIPLAGCDGLFASLGDSLTQVYRLGTSEYFVEYPEDIRLYGLSFSTNLPIGSTLSGEISYRPNLPVQINPVDLGLANIGVPELSPLLSSGAMSSVNGAVDSGYRRKEVTQAQVALTHFFDQVMGADRLTFVGEVGVTHVGGLEKKGGIRYGRGSAYGQGELYPDNSLCTSRTNSAFPDNCEDDGYVTSTSWGYRTRLIAEYNNVIQGLELKPNLAWSHDVSGYGPEPGFNEGAKAISIGLDAVYLSTYTASVAYTNFFDGKYNTNVDRDFLAMSFGVSF